MPLYMDTHQYVEGLTADAAAHAHQADVKMQEKYGVTARDTGLAAFDSNYVTPYVQNMTLAVTRNIGRETTPFRWATAVMTSGQTAHSEFRSDPVSSCSAIVRVFWPGSSRVGR